MEVFGPANGAARSALPARRSLTSRGRTSDSPYETRSGRMWPYEPGPQKSPKWLGPGTTEDIKNGNRSRTPVELGETVMWIGAIWPSETNFTVCGARTQEFYCFWTPAGPSCGAPGDGSKKITKIGQNGCARPPATWYSAAANASNHPNWVEPCYPKCCLEVFEPAN